MALQTELRLLTADDTSVGGGGVNSAEAGVLTREAFLTAAARVLALADDRRPRRRLDLGEGAGVGQGALVVAHTSGDGNETGSSDSQSDVGSDHPATESGSESGSEEVAGERTAVGYARRLTKSDAMDLIAKAQADQMETQLDQIELIGKWGRGCGGNAAPTPPTKARRLPTTDSQRQSTRRDHSRRHQLSHCRRPFPLPPRTAFIQVLCTSWGSCGTTR